MAEHDEWCETEAITYTVKDIAPISASRCWRKPRKLKSKYPDYRLRFEVETPRVRKSNAKYYTMIFVTAEKSLSALIFLWSSV
jgi:hypothetical protein